MRLIWRQMIGIGVVVLVAMTCVCAAFLSATTNTIRNQTWNNLNQCADSLIQDDEVLIDRQTNKLVGFEWEAIDSKSKLLSRQNVYFAVYDGQHRRRYDNSQGFAPQITASDWSQLKKGTVLRKRTAYPDPVAFAKAHKTNAPQLMVLIKPYFVNNKLVAVVAIGSFLSTVKKNYHEIASNLLLALIISLLVAIVVSYIVARSQTKRIDQMEAATKEIAKGNYQIQLPNHGKDELDDLSDNLNQMAASLKASQAELEADEERRQELLANAAHEMRTPLTTINGLLEGLIYDAIPQENRQHSLELMQKETKRLIRLVNDNLSYEKLRTNQIQMNRENFDAHVVFDNLRDQLKPIAVEKHDEITIEMPQPLRVFADHDRFVEIFFNIMQNAVQFTDQGQITVTGRRRPQGAEFKVADTGIGMTESQTAKIFERFYKADRSRMNTKYGESGIGMALVKELVQLHNGTINVESTPHKGTTFTLFFPDRGSSENTTDDQQKD